MKRRMKLTAEQEAELKDAFQLFDTEREGSISGHELKVCLRALGFHVSKKEANSLVEEFDVEDTGRIQLQDFLTIMARKHGERDPREEVARAFQLFDEDGTGKITLRNLRRVARELGESLSEDELQSMIDEFDTDLDGKISRQEFEAIMLQ